MRSGTILRFDDVRGYGFIAQEGGGEDVFVHANELCDDKARFTAGTPVEFEVTEGSRGLKASAVYLASREGPLEGATSPAPDDDGMCDVLSTSEFLRELTELMLGADSGLTAGQIVRLRQELLSAARRHGWVEG